MKRTSGFFLAFAAVVPAISCCGDASRKGGEGERCAATADCIEGLRCVGNVCARDSGADGGAADGGVADAGEFDGGAVDGGGGTGPCSNVRPEIKCEDLGGNLGWMCPVQAGCFMMGCNSAVDYECGAGEKPYHMATLSACKIDKYEVTASKYKDCVAAGKCTPAGTSSGCNYNDAIKGSHPINCVDWNQAKAYCAWAGKRLPTEAEWEKAARGTDERKYPWGNSGLDCDHAVWNYTSCGNTGTQAVPGKPQGFSPYGTMDMLGNVWEWVEDDYHSNYDGAPAGGGAWVDSPRGALRILRGGSWGNMDAADLRASARSNGDPSTKSSIFGFRCAKD
jgi:formylglycine-generating enzyme required for sulfatase activity